MNEQNEPRIKFNIDRPVTAHRVLVACTMLMAWLPAGWFFQQENQVVYDIMQGFYRSDDPEELCRIINCVTLLERTLDNDRLDAGVRQLIYQPTALN